MLLVSLSFVYVYVLGRLLSCGGCDGLPITIMSSHHQKSHLRHRRLESANNMPSSKPSALLYLSPSSSIPSAWLSAAPSVPSTQAPSILNTHPPSIYPSAVSFPSHSGPPVNEDTYIPSSSNRPSFSPSLSPNTSSIQVPSNLSSQQKQATSEPSDLPYVSQLPTIGNEHDDSDNSSGWDIVTLADPTIAFSDASKTEEIKLFLNISDRDTHVTVFERGCRTPVSTSVIEVAKHFVSRSDTHGDLVVSLDVKKSTLSDSPIWSWNKLESNLAHIDICVRVELLVHQPSDNSTSAVNFLDSELAITLNMAIGLNSASSHTQMEKFGVFEHDVSANFFVESCQCNDAWQCISKPLYPGDFLNMCLHTNSSGTRFKSLDSFRLRQSLGESGSIELYDTKVNTGKVMSEVTNVVIDGNRLKVTTKPTNSFFWNGDATFVIVDGFTLIEFGALGGRRHLRANVVHPKVRALEGRSGHAGFTKKIEIRSGSYSSSSSASPFRNSWSLALTTIMALAMTTFAIF